MARHLNRRQALQSLAGTAALTALPAAGAADRKKLPVAGVVTEYRTNSHADVICGKILEGFQQDGGPGPDLELVSLYTDQVPQADLSRDLASKHGFRLASSIEESITLGTNKVQVAGVLSIGEHGNYPSTPDTHQQMYPRKRFFDEIIATFKKCGSVVPVFNDKHLCYNWKDARAMYDTARKMKIPFMAGSSLPVAWREPQEILPMGCVIEEALVLGYGGLEAYGFHMLETLQCMMERRQGGETGVRGVQALQGERAWQAQQQGRWSGELFKAAAEANGQVVSEDKLRASMMDGNSAVYLLDYRNNIKASAVMAVNLGAQFCLALKLQGRDKPWASWFQLEDKKPYGHFAYLVRAIEEMIHTGQPSYPVERTLLTTGILDRAMHSLAADGAAYRTPELAIRYRSVEWPFANQAGDNPYPCQ